MPPEAKVAIFEDDPRFVKIYKTLLKGSGHTVVAETSTIDNVRTVLETFRERGVQVAIIDGNLSSGDRSGEDGRMINAVIKQRFPGIKTIGISGSGGVEGADLSLSKTDTQKLGKLGGLVTNL